MRHDRDATHLCPSQRFTEVTCLLAKGVRALRDRAALPAHQPPENSLKSAQDCLELSRDRRLSVHRG